MYGIQFVLTDGLETYSYQLSHSKTTSVKKYTLNAN